MWSVFCVFAALCILRGPVSAARTAEEEQHLLDESGKIIFLLYSRENPIKPWEFELNDLDYLQYTSFNVSRPTRILIHGWTNYWGSDINILLRDAFLIQYNVNLIVVSWDTLAAGQYITARYNVEIAGKVVAFMIDKLCTEVGMNIKDVHVIGHSLGAHVAGISGLFTSVGKLPRVTGLDPAGPLFTLEDKLKISQKSADFVDIIHTAAWKAGTVFELGHADFYPNGGTSSQPGCGEDIESIRSHRRAYWLYAYSILTPGGFLAVKCESWESYIAGKCKGNDIEEMGEHVSIKLLKGNSTEGHEENSI